MIIEKSQYFEPAPVRGIEAQVDCIGGDHDNASAGTIDRFFRAEDRRRRHDQSTEESTAAIADRCQLEWAFRSAGKWGEGLMARFLSSLKRRRTYAVIPV